MKNYTGLLIEDEIPRYITVKEMDLWTGNFVKGRFSGLPFTMRDLYLEPYTAHGISL